MYNFDKSNTLNLETILFSIFKPCNKLPIHQTSLIYCKIKNYFNIIEKLSLHGLHDGANLYT